MSNFDHEEDDRLACLEALHTLDAKGSSTLDTITHLASQYFAVPVSMISTIDQTTHWTLSAFGTEREDKPRQLSLCDLCVRTRQVVVIEDTAKDPRSQNNPQVTCDNGLRFYAGAPILVGDHTIGAICLVDHTPRTLSEPQVEFLEGLAKQTALILKTATSPSPPPKSKDRHYLEEEFEQFLQRPSAMSDLMKLMTQDGVWYWDLDDPDHEWMSDSFWTTLGYDPDAMPPLASAWQNIINQEDLAAALDNFKKHCQDPNHPYDQVVRYQHKDGSTVYVHCRGVAVRDAEGKPRRMLGIHTDITGWDDALKLSEDNRKFRELIIENIPDMVFVKDDQFRIVEANQNFLATYPEDIRETVIGTTTLEHYNEVEREAFLVEDRRAFAEGLSEIEESIQFPDGERRVLQTRKIRFEHHQGKSYILGVAHDVTRQKDLENKLVEAREATAATLAETETHLNTVLNTATSAIIGIGTDKRILTMNSAARHLLGGLNDTLPIRWPNDFTFLDIEDMSTLDGQRSPIDRALKGQHLRGEIHLMNRSHGRDHRYVRITSSPVHDGHPDLSCVVILDDVSEAEKHRQQVERQSRLDALGQLTGGIAHDFNNLLATVSYAIELVRGEDLSERGRNFADTALNAVRRGSELTNRLLAFAKRQPGKAASRSVSAIWKDMESLLMPTIEELINVELVPPSKNLFVHCDQAQLENALLNLVLNSRDAILRGNRGNFIRVEARALDGLSMSEEPQGKTGEVLFGEGRRRLGTDESDKRDRQRFIEISVTDNGPGMTDAVKARAVDPFFTTKKTNSGTGLGLSMVYGFIQQSDGELRIYSEVGHGTTIRLLLPKGDDGTGSHEPESHEPIARGQGETILLVEDERPLLDILEETICALGYRVLCAGSGRDALQILESNKDIDLLLTDVVMPGGTGGFELAAIARRQQPHLPIIYMSGYTGFSPEEMGEVVAPLLAKPSSPKEISITIRKVLDSVENKGNV